MSKVEKECQTCGQTFLADSREINRGNARFCSLSCAAKAPKQLQYPQVCKHCGKDFISASKNAKYCSDSCKQKNYRARQKSLSEDTDSIKVFYKIFEISAFLGLLLALVFTFIYIKHLIGIAYYKLTKKE